MIRFLRSWATASSRVSHRQLPALDVPAERPALVCVDRHRSASARFGRQAALAAGSRIRLLDHLLQLPRFGLRPMAFLERDLPVELGGEQPLVHRLHAELLPGLHQGVDLVGLALADDRRDGRGADQDLRHDDPSAAAHPGDELLGHDALQHEGQLGQDLLLLVGWERRPRCG